MPTFDLDSKTFIGGCPKPSGHTYIPAMCDYYGSNPLKSLIGGSGPGRTFYGGEVGDDLGDTSSNRESETGNVINSSTYNPGLTTGDIYIATGYNGTNDSDYTEWYDGNSWTQLSNAPAGVRDSRFAYDDTRHVIWMLGGEDSDNSVFYDTLWQYDIETDTWSSVSNIPLSAIQEHGIEYHDGKLYSVGGRDDSGNTIATVHIYDIGNDSWSTGASMPTPRWEHDTTLHADDIYAVGGQDGSTEYATLERYDILQDSWDTLTDMPHAAYGVTMVTHDDHLYAGFGYNSGLGGHQAQWHRYSPTSDAWTSLTDCPSVHSYASGAVGQDGNIWILGGYSGSYSGRTDYYDPGQDNWVQGDTMGEAHGMAIGVTVP